MNFLSSKSRLVRRLRYLLGLAVMAWVFCHASAGIRWSEYFHPDELTIAHWMKQSYKIGYIKDRAYAGGWFVLVNAKDRIASGFWNIGCRWRKHVEQTGHVNAVEEKSFDYAPEKETLQIDEIQRGRDFNVWLVTFAALFLYLTALEMGASAPAAALGALLLGAHPYVLLHSHYCESDSAIPFAMCLAAWLAARAIRLLSARWFLAAMFATGFAISCKYTLVALILWPFVFAAPLALGATQGRRSLRYAALAAGGLAMLAIGFLVGTPALYHDPRFFLDSMHRERVWVYAEGVRTLGKAYHSASARYAWRASSLLRELAPLGVDSLLFFGLSLVVWFRRRLRCHLGGFPLFVLLFPFLAIFMMPWIRNQELLSLVPPLCLGTALASDWAGHILLQRGSVLRRAAAGLFLVLAACGFAETLCNGNRILTSFQRRDTRAECQNWLAETAGENVVLALDSYVSQSIRGTDCTGVGYFLPAETWPQLRDNPTMLGITPRYVLRNASFTGRHLRQPDWGHRVADFRRDCLLLRSWEISPGLIRPTTFAQPDIELWALPDSRDDNVPDIPVVLDRPIYFTPGMRSLYAAKDTSGIGPQRAVQTVGQRHPYLPVPDLPGWAVSRMVAGPPTGTVVWEDFAEPRKKNLIGNGVAVFRFDVAALRRRSVSDVRPETRLRLRNADDQVSVCATWPVAHRAEAARALRRGGAPVEALALLREVPELDAVAKTEAFLAAKEAGENPESEWTKAAEQTLEALERGMAALAAGSDIRIRGVPLHIMRDFANVRIFPHRQPLPDTLPIFLPPGTYRVSILPSFEAPLSPGGILFRGQNRPAEMSMDREGNSWWSSTVAQNREGLLSTLPEARSNDERLGIGFRRLAVTWDPADQLPRLDDELRKALAAQKAQ